MEGVAADSNAVMILIVRFNVGVLGGLHVYNERNKYIMGVLGLFKKVHGAIVGLAFLYSECGEEKLLLSLINRDLFFELTLLAHVVDGLF